MQFSQIIPAPVGLNYVEINEENLTESKVYPVLCWGLTGSPNGDKSRIIGLTTPTYLLKNNPNLDINDLNSLVPVPDSHGVYMNPDDDCDFTQLSTAFLRKVATNNLKAKAAVNKDSQSPVSDNPILVDSI